MSLDLNKSFSLTGKSVENTTTQGNMSATISKGQQVSINIYLNSPETLNVTDARTDVVQFIAQVFSYIQQTKTEADKAAQAEASKNQQTGSSASSSTASKDESADKGSTAETDSKATK